MSLLFPYLPQDNLNAVSKSGATGALELQVEGLGSLLEMSEAKFWSIVENDPSIMQFLGSFLRYSLRPHDLSLGSLSQASPSERPQGGGGDDDYRSSHQRITAWYEPTARQLLLRRAFSLVLRLVTPWTVSESPVKSGRPHTEVLASLQLLDLPQLMDLCAIYGPWSPKLTATVAARFLKWKPAILEDLAAAAKSIFTSNLQQVLDRSFSLLASVATDSGTGGSSRGNVDSGAAARTGLLDACAYLYDFVSTLYLTLACLPDGSTGALRPAVPVLLETLASCYAGLLAPAHDLAQSRALADAPLGRQLATVTRAAASVLQALVWHLVKEQHLVAGAGSSPTAAPADPKGKGKARADTVAPADPKARGEAFLSTLRQLSSLADAEGGSLPSLLGGIAQRFHLERWVATACFQGLLFLEDDQFDHMLQLCGGSAEDGAELRIKEARKAAHKGPTGASSKATAASAAGPSGCDETRALQLSLVSGLKDIFGDMYGDGFLVACLDHFGNNAERVTNALLEGALPAALEKLDPQLQTFAAAGVGASAAKPSAAGTAGASGSSAAPAPTQLWLAAYAGLEPRDTVAAVPAERSSSSAATSAPSAFLRSDDAAASRGGRGKAGKVDRSTAKLLDAASNQTKRAALRLADLIASMEGEGEYGDEYDDSFDDLAFFGPGGDASLDDVSEAHRSRAGGGGGGGAGAAAGPSSTAVSSGAQAKGGRKGKPPPPSLYVYEGRVYNYRKEGAVGVTNQAEADRVVALQLASHESIEGLGAGGNKARLHAAAAAPPAPPSGISSLNPRPTHGTGSGAGPGGPGQGPAGPRGERDPWGRVLKERGVIGSHHRKDRAAAKMAKGML